MIDALHLGMVLQEVHHLQCVLHVALQAEGKCLQALQEQEGIKGRNGRALIPHQRGAELEDVGQVAAGLGENDTVIGGVGLGDAGELVVLSPVEFSGVNHDAAHDRTVAADEFGGGMYHDIRAVFNGAEIIGRCEGVVHNQRDAVAVGDSCDRSQVNDVGVGIAQGLGVDQLRVFLDCRLKILRLRRVYKGHVQALIPQGVGKQVVGAAVEVGGGDDMVAGAGNVLNGVSDGRCTGGGSKGRSAAFQSGNALLKNGGGGIHQAGVDVSALGEAESARRLSGVLENVRGSGVDRYRTGIRGGIGAFLTGVYLQGFKFIIAHLFSSFLFVRICFSLPTTSAHSSKSEVCPQQSEQDTFHIIPTFLVGYQDHSTIFLPCQ